MIRGSVVLLGSLLALCSRGVDACPVVTWQVTQSAGGTCPSQMSGGGGLAYDNMIKDVVAASKRRRLAFTEDCAAVNPSPSTASCVPVQHIPEKPETHRRRLGVDGCQQCSGADDDADDASYGHDDGDRRRLTYGYDTGYKGSYMTFTITAEVAPDEDPMDVIDTVESDLNAYFLDGRTSCHDWMTNAVALGEEVPEGTHVYFSQTVVDNDSVHISRPGDFLDHHYNSNSNVRIGVWVGGSVAFLALALMTTYGVKSYRQQRTVPGGDDNADRQQVQVDGITLNPLSESVTEGTSSEMSQDDSSDKEV